jgi:4-hydroxy-tetrahydrodipicolinate reductase
MSPLEPRRLCVVGAGGRLGSAIVGLAEQHGFRVTLERRRGADERADGEPAEVVVDVSAPAALPASIAYAERCAAGLVVGTSGLSRADRQRLEQAARRLRVLVADNFSFGHHVQARLARVLAECCADRAAEFLVVDRHPTSKRDAPSATALRLAATIEASGGASQVASLRCGAPVSAHEVIATLPGETLTLAHAVSERSVLADGALRAARWLLAAGGPGLFAMADVYDSRRAAVAP